MPRHTKIELLSVTDDGRDPPSLCQRRFPVRSDIAIRRDQALVNCAFSFSWAAWSAHPPPSPATPPAPGADGGERGSRARRAAPAATMLAPGDPGGARLVGPVDRATALVAGMVQGALARQLQALMTSLEAGHGLHLYVPR